MKRTFLPLLLILVLVVSMTGCGSGTADGIKIPFSSGVAKSQDYQKLLTDLDKAGFTNVETEVIDDLITGFTTKDGEVEQVSVDGDAKYNADARYPVDVAIVVAYHTFPEKDKSEKSSSVEHSSEPDTESPEIVENITTNNNSEFFAVMAVTNEYDSSIKSFVETYKGKIIEFDGCIILLNNHESYDTRYDILFSGGDYVDEDTVNLGPLFKMEDINITDMGIKDLYLPDFIKVGHNVKITAKISGYNSDLGLFMLNPVLVEER